MPGKLVWFVVAGCRCSCWVPMENFYGHCTFLAFAAAMSVPLCLKGVLGMLGEWRRGGNWRLGTTSSHRRPPPSGNHGLLYVP